MLKDGRNAKVASAQRAVDLHLLPANGDVPLIRLKSARENRYEGRLACAVITDERDDLPWEETYVNAIKRLDVPEVLGQAGCLDDRLDVNGGSRGLIPGRHSPLGALRSANWHQPAASIIDSTVTPLRSIERGVHAR